jgi:hypothetical protein
VSQSLGDGFASNASVTGAYESSGFAAAGHFGSSTPGVIGPPGLAARRRCCSVISGLPGGWAEAAPAAIAPAHANTIQGESLLMTAAPT